MNGQEFYKFAAWLYSKLDSSNPNEASIRSIISRAYYAAFLEARDQAAIRSSGGSVHKIVIEHYRGKGQIGNRIGNRLSDLFYKRSKADYDNHSTINAREAQKSLKLCESIVSDLSKMPGS